MFKNTLSVISLAVSIMAISLVVFQIYNAPKIAFVHNAKLFSEYKGVSDMRAEYQSKLEVWQSNLDTLTSSYRAELNLYEKDKVKMSKAEQVASEKYLKNKEQELIRYKYAIEEKAGKEEEKYNEAIVNQLNNFIVDYGKGSRYDYILGVTENGSIMYSRDSHDITDDVINKMNARYEGK